MSAGANVLRRISASDAIATESAIVPRQTMSVRAARAILLRRFAPTFRYARRCCRSSGVLRSPFGYHPARIKKG